MVGSSFYVNRFLCWEICSAEYFSTSQEDIDSNTLRLNVLSSILTLQSMN